MVPPCPSQSDAIYLKVHYRLSRQITVLVPAIKEALCFLPAHTRHDRAAPLRGRPGSSDRHFISTATAVDIRYSRRLPESSDTMQLYRIFQGLMNTCPFSAGVNL